ncbi:hypothetical protein ACLOJK_034230, partial [Asimina triloba]
MAAEPITAGDHEQTPVRLRPPFPPSSRSPSQIRWPHTISRPIIRSSSLPNRAAVPPSISDPDPSACNPDSSEQAPQTIK